jgi:hypothetical protein
MGGQRYEWRDVGRFKCFNVSRKEINARSSISFHYLLGSQYLLTFSLLVLYYISSFLTFSDATLSRKTL